MFALLLTVAMLMPLGTRSIRFSGTEFILAFCEHKNHRSAPVLTIINDNDDLITVNISTPRSPDVIPLTTKVVKDFLTFALPEEAIQLFTSKHSLGIHVTSDQEIYVQGFNTASYSIGAFLALPVSQLGTEYTVVTLCESNVCLFMIVATEDDTDVTVNFQIAQGKVNFNNVNYQSEDTLEITLQTYETLQLQCSVDLSGTYVTATRPVAVYSGSDYTEVDYYQHYDGKDNIVEQMPPITALGSMYVLPPFPDLPDTYQIKVVSISDNNSINVSGKTYKLEKGQVFLRKLIPDNIHIITSTDKILLTVIINNFGYYGIRRKTTVDGSLTVVYPEDKRQILMSLGRTFRFRAIAPAGKASIEYIWFIIVTDKTCDIRESSIASKDNVSDYGVEMFNFLPKIKENVDKDLVTLTGCPIYSGTLWMKGRETACMLPWPGNYRPWEKHVTDGAEGFTICNSSYWRLYLLQRGFSVRVLFDRVYWFVNQCCVPTLL